MRTVNSAPIRKNTPKKIVPKPLPAQPDFDVGVVSTEILISESSLSIVTTRPPAQ